MSEQELEKINRRFCDDMKLPIQIFHEPYFSNRLDLFEGMKAEYELFIKMLETEFNCSQDYFEYYNLVKDQAINFIKNSTAFKKLEETDMSQYPTNTYSTSDLYKETNIGQAFISIDLKKANFNALKVFATATNTVFFDGEYEDFIRQFENGHPLAIEYIIKSKYIRQVIFGNCNPKKLIRFETAIILDMIDNFVDAGLIHDKSKIYSVCSDELILRAPAYENQKAIIIQNWVNDHYDIPIKVEYFYLYKVRGTDAFIKTYLNGTEELKCLNAFDAPFVIRWLRKEELKETDKYFYFNGRLSKFIDGPEISIEVGDPLNFIRGIKK